jgi:hypothetical protein
VPFTQGTPGGINAYLPTTTFKEERSVSMWLEVFLLIVALLGLSMGSCCIYWVNVRPSARQAWWGRRLFVVALLILGGAALLAAFTHAEGLAPLSLLSGLLIVGMLWENPAAVATDDSTSTPAR